jgi:hypothetical protein
VCWAEQVKWSKTTNKEASRRGKDSEKKGDETPQSDKGGTVERQIEAVEDEEREMSSLICSYLVIQCHVFSIILMSSQQQMELHFFFSRLTQVQMSLSLGTYCQRIQRRVQSMEIPSCEAYSEVLAAFLFHAS